MKKLIPTFILIVWLATACQWTKISSFPTPTPAGSTLPSSAGAAQSDSQSSGSSLPGTPLPTATPRPTPEAGGVATLGLIGQPESLNPLLDDSSAMRELTPLLFDTLLRVDPQTAELQPGLAESWDFSMSGRHLSLHLPAGLRWSNGTPLTAESLKQSLEATRHPALLAFSQITVPDDHTLKLTFTRVDCSAVTALAQVPLIPASQDLDEQPLGSGPFRAVNRYTQAGELTLTRNPYYHGAPAYLDELHLRFFPDSAAAEIALNEGQFDAVGPFDPFVSNPAPNELLLLAYPEARVYFMALNFAPRNETPLSLPVRRALTLALDREAILTEALGDDGQLTAGSLLPEHWANPADLAIPAYDPEQARRLLAQAGLRDSDLDGWLDRDGQRLELQLRLNGENSLHQNLGWLISSYYRDLGLYVRTSSGAAESVIDDLFTHDFELALFSWPILPDPDQRLFWHSTENREGEGLNFVSYRNPELDRLLDRGANLPGCRGEQRAELYTQVQQALNRDRPVDFLLIPNRHLFVAQRLMGLEPGPFAPLTWNASQWHVQREP
ncbi:MAG TPA: ABC transporter substrate-binding protein [Anaerolineae bacterium]|nr:ABC transporter substrate-binding protein [Anaerolineae bacterium]HMR64306.1 ABC transporter substrate-binding protein [Anaerolineae bacterium]